MDENVSFINASSNFMVENNLVIMSGVASKERAHLQSRLCDSY